MDDTATKRGRVGMESGARPKSKLMRDAVPTIFPHIPAPSTASCLRKERAEKRLKDKKEVRSRLCLTNF